MSCPHGVYSKDYCQICNYGCSGGIFTPAKISTEEDELELRHWFCLKCLGTSKAIYDGGIWCVDCGYEDKEK